MPRLVTYGVIGTVLGIVLLAGGFLVGFWLRTSPVASYVPDVITPVANTPSELIAEAYAILEANQFDFAERSPAVLAEGAVKGLVDALDERFTTYLSAAERTAFSNSLEGEYVGIGIGFLVNQEGSFTVAEVYAGGPAETAGMLVGDKIIKVDGTDVVGYPQNEFIATVLGVKGDPVLITFIRTDDGAEPSEMEFNIVRDTFSVPAVGSTTSADGRYGVLNIFGFSNGLIKELEPAICGLAGADICAPEFCPASGCGSVAGLVIDLRRNSGGYVDDVIEAASIFIPQGDANIVAYELDSGGRRNDWKVRNSSVKFTLLPIVVLVDQYSASGAEAFAGALRDHQRAVIVGETTLGKGSVNTLFELTNGGGINITTARWYTPCGALIENLGITPDVELIPSGEADGLSDVDDGLALALQQLENWSLPPSSAACSGS